MCSSQGISAKKPLCMRECRNQQNLLNPDDRRILSRPGIPESLGPCPNSTGVFCHGSLSSCAQTDCPKESNRAASIQRNFLFSISQLKNACKRYCFFPICTNKCHIFVVFSDRYLWETEKSINFATSRQINPWKNCFTTLGDTKCCHSENC